MIVYGIVASPRKGGNTDLLLTHTLRGAAAVGAETEKIYIHDLEIKPCLDCEDEPDDECLIKDDMAVIYDLLRRADYIVIGTPIYYGTVPGPLKNLIDRCNCIQGRITKKKKVLLVVTSDRSHRLRCLLRLIEIWSTEVSGDIVDLIIVTDTGKRSVSERPGLLDHAYYKGQTLIKGSLPFTRFERTNAIF